MSNSPSDPWTNRCTGTHPDRRDAGQIEKVSDSDFDEKENKAKTANDASLQCDEDV